MRKIYIKDLPREDIINMYISEGLPVGSIAEKYGVSYSCARNNLIRSGVELISTTQRRLNLLDKDTLYDLYIKQEKSQACIAKQYGVSRDTIHRHLVKYGIEKSIEILKHSMGYRMVLRPEHPRQYRNYVLEHIIIYEEHYKTKLPDGWVIHHIDMDKANNSIDNLLAMESHSKHMKLHCQYNNLIKSIYGKLGRITLNKERCEYEFEEVKNA